MIRCFLVIPTEADATYRFSASTIIDAFRVASVQVESRNLQFYG